MVLEDFAKNDIYLRYSDGSVSYKSEQYVRKRRAMTNYNWWTATEDTSTELLNTDTTDDTTTAISYTSPIYDPEFITTLIYPLGTSADTTYREFIDSDTAKTDTSSTETPVIDTSSTETPVIDTSSTETPVIDTSSTETPVTDTPSPETPVRDTFNTETLVTDTPSPNTPIIDISSPPPGRDNIVTSEAYTTETTKITDLDLTETTTYLETTTVMPSSSDITETTTPEATWVPETDTIRYPTGSLSKIPLQFAVEVTSTVSLCTYGVYRPLFLPPTPNNGEILHARARMPFEIHLAAQATHSSIADFRISGPYNMTKGAVKRNGNSATKIIEWTPTDNDVGDHVPFCFVAETTNGYNSELRCIIVIVDNMVRTTLLCNENTMTLFIQKTLSNGLYDNHLRLIDPRCLLTSNSTHHIASVGFNSCGTEIEETEDSIVFKNQVTSFDDLTSVITRKHQVVISFNCTFPKKNRLSVSFRPKKALFEFTEAGFGNFTYKFQFYTSDQFTIVQTQSPLEVWLRDMLYMEIQVMSSVPNVQLFVESCKASPHDNPDDPVFYNIIENGCLKDETLKKYTGTNTRSRFGLEAFTFIGNYEEVYVSCTVILCKLGDPNTRCARGCVARSSRRRRSLTAEATESLQHFISQGPLRMKRQSLNQDSGGKVALNINTLIMSLSGVAVLALVALTAYFIMKNSRTTNYQRLSTVES
ncbi:uncharacterized protein LOC134579228 [Pelobates fuscus]|uniref:uncharacterized protein LOC134579228 n=1 Tax=Pelobates fuscus TaxID=191477 RepID=UPI002FE4F0B9